jgi:hypothetical protein
MLTFRPQPAGLASRRVAEDAEDAGERLAQLVGEMRAIVGTNEALAQRLAEQHAATPDTVFAALLLAVIDQRETAPFLERLNRQLERIPRDGKVWQFISRRA